MVNGSVGSKTIVFILVILLLTGVAYYILYFPEDGETKEPGKPGNGSGDNISKLKEEVDKINQKTLAWVEELDVNPITLRDEMGIKGKKKFVELLDIYLGLYQTTNDPKKKTEYRNTVLDLSNVTYNESYHDLTELDEKQLREDSTSYLRAWFILHEFGLNTTEYEKEIEKAKPTIDDHLPSRGTNQKMAFVFYYNQLGYPIEYTMEGLFTYSQIRSRDTVQNLTELDVYFITHEIFFLFDGNQMDLLTHSDIDYVEQMLGYHVNKTISENNVDLLAELLMIMNYLGLNETYEFEIALDVMLKSQNEDGSFGYYEQYRDYYEEQNIDIEIQLYLHTTEVSIRALNEAIQHI